LCRFQFLIGTIKTVGDVIAQMMLNRFQFLIGTIKTARSVDFATSSFKVSIPYRYDKNDGLPIPVVLPTRVSIPYRYDKNKHRLHYYVGQCKVSIPYRYDKNAEKRALAFTSSIGFNSL